LIAGAGAAGQLVVKELQRNPQLGLQPIGFLDDDPAKVGMRLANLPVLGSLDQAREIIELERIQEVIIAMPSAPGLVVRRIVRAAYEAGAHPRTVPDLGDIITQKVSVTALREVQIDDLLRREPIRTDLAAVSELAANRTVLVTGAGGSIGSELCRQLAALGPARIILLGSTENPIFDIQNELLAHVAPDVLVPAIVDVRDVHRMRATFDEHRPYAVFHAAAHKHVPLMEANVADAITNNILGTRTVVETSIEFDVAHLVFVSTDKAVRPTNVMGATKRIAEQIVLSAAHRQRRNFVSVRFGNVLGSHGSVVPTFLRQIRAGGPVTVTHPDMRRFFMTIPEAVQLILQAAAMGRGGELFMLDMGEPIHIVDLARDMIRLSGLVEGTDIEIRYVGVRPGEKLFEELLTDPGVAEPTEHPKILRAREGLEQCSDADIDSLIAAAAHAAPESELRRCLSTLVPDFVPAEATYLTTADGQSITISSGTRGAT
jgi:FlaA1/EpsC-like NDP-sugar epimerase